MIEARIIADSINPVGNRLTTFVCTYPRFIHSEVMTHRQFSRNAASSRAIPVQKMIERIRQEPAGPVYWGKAQKGMQAGEELAETAQQAAEAWWHDACESAIFHAERLLDLGVHKQIANRLLEPFAHMTTIITASEWGNFFNLRAHKDAQPEFQELAFKMLEVYSAKEPTRLEAGEWHLPFMDAHVEILVGDLEADIKIATARCARVSYLTFEGQIDPEKDFKLHDDLLASGHMSPFEHCARAEATAVRSGNFVGFTQYRKMLANECRSEFDPVTLLAMRKGKNAASNHLAKVE